MSTLRSNKSKSINPILKYFTDLKNSDKSASIKHSHISLRPLLVLLMFKRKNRDFRFFQKHVFFWLKKNAMTTFRSNNSKNINPISKYFTDLKFSDNSALIKNSHTSLRPLILLLIIVCKIVFWVGMIKSSSNAPYIQRKSFLILYIHGLMPCYDWLYVSVSVCMSLKRNLIKIYVMLT